MLIIYIVLRAVRDEMDYLRGLNTVPDEPVSVNRHSGRPTGGNYVSEPPQDHSEVTFFTGLGTLVFAGISGVSKSASQLWSKDFGGGESMILDSCSSFLTRSQLLRACMIFTCAYGGMLLIHRQARSRRPRHAGGITDDCYDAVPGSKSDEQCLI